MTTIKNVVFDFGGVLLDWNPRYFYSSIFNDDEKMEYIAEMREKALHDEATAINTAEKRGEKRGMEKARAEGLAEGREEGRKAREAEIAEKMRKIGMTEEQINSILKS